MTERNSAIRSTAEQTWDPHGLLAHSSAFVDLLLETMPSPAIVVTEDRRIVLANRAFARVAGTTESAIVGRRAGEILGCTSADNITCENCVDAGGCAACRIAYQGFEYDGPVRALTRLDVIANGRVAPVDIALSANTFTLNNERMALVIFHYTERLSRIRRLEPEKRGLHGIVGRHHSMLTLFETIRRVGPSNLPVLIQGESGTGKEMVAVALHRESRRATRPLVCVNSGALPEGVLESELFGHVRGAFTGAVRDKRGRFEIANNGTLFLDEIGEIPPSMQVKLLRVLQEGTFERVGSEQTTHVDVRLICATNRNLESDVANGRFRPDLFYRISVVPITVPPLRARRSDIALLVQHFLERTAAENKCRAPEVAEETMEILLRYMWPGNVRELENVLRFAMVYGGGSVLRPEHLPPRILTDVATAAARTRLDIRRVKNALVSAGGNKCRAAQLLGVSRATLYRFLEETDAPKPARKVT